MKRKILTIALCLGITFSSTVIYRGQDSKANGYGISNPRIEKDGTVTWDCICFGKYWQNDTNGDGIADQNDEKEPIKWRVLSVVGNDAFLLSDKGIDTQPYNKDVTDEKVLWKDCSIRNWLDNEFFNSAFVTSEQNNISPTDVADDKGNITNDKIYLLSHDDVLNPCFGFNNKDESESKTRETNPTKYALDCGALIAPNNNGFWWVRSFGKGKYEIYPYVSAIGTVQVQHLGQMETFNTQGIIRPCLHLDLSSDTWSNAGTVTATGGTFTTPTPVPTDTPAPTDTPVPTIEPTAVPMPTSAPTEVLTPTQLPTVQPTTQPTLIPTPTSKPMQSSTLAQKPKVTAPSKPKISSIKNNKKRTVTLSWNKVSGASGYQLEYATNEAFSKKSKTLKATKVIINKLTKKKTYSFRVRAYALDGNKKLYGKWSTVKRIKIKK